MSNIDEALGAWGAFGRDDPFPLFADVRARGAVHEVTLQDGHAAWLVMGFAEARALLNDPRLSKDLQAALSSGDEVVAAGLPGPDFARHMLVVDPPDHTRLRRLVSAAFSNKRTESLRPRVQALVDDLLDDIEAQGPDAVVDLVASFAFPLPFTVICELLGVPDCDRGEFARNMTTLLTPTTDDASYAVAVEASDAVVGYLTAMVAAKHDAPGDDLVSALISARDGDAKLNQQELLSTVFQLIVAGHDTTTTLIGNGTVALLAHPDQLDDLRADPSRIPAAIEELLRYDSPVPHSTFRFATEPIEVAEAVIPAGAQVIICLASANHDAAHFHDPEQLELGRADERHLAFGHGIHFCLGAALARMEGQVAFTSLLHRFPELRLAVPRDQLHWGHGDGLVLRGLSSLPVMPGPARPR